MRRIIVGAAAAAMVAGSSVAQAAPAALDARGGSPMGEFEQLSGTNGAHIVLGLFAAILLAVVLWQINDDDDVDLPVSP